MASRFRSSFRSLLVGLTVLALASVAGSALAAPSAPCAASETEGAPSPTPDPTKPIPW